MRSALSSGELPASSLAGVFRKVLRCGLPAAIAASALFLAALCLPTMAQAANPGPAWSIHSLARPTNFVPGDDSGNASYTIFATNIGTRATDGSPVTITDTLPPGVTATGSGVTGLDYQEKTSISCAGSPLQCTYTGGAIAPGDILEMDIYVTIDPSASGSVTNAVTVDGGGAASTSTSVQNQVSASPAPFGISNFSFEVTGPDGALDTQAGAHPDAVTTTLDLNSRQLPPGSGSNSTYMGAANVKDVVVDLPLGFVGNALAAPKCPLDELVPNNQVFNQWECPANTRIGEVTLQSVLGSPASSVAGSGSSVPVSPLFNMVPEHGHPAEFGFAIAAVASVHLYASVVHTNAGYVLRVTSPDLPAQNVYPHQKGFLTGVTLTLFGDPAAHYGSGNPSTAFFTNPVDCAASGAVATAHVDTWANQGRVNPDGSPDFSDPNWLAANSSQPPVTGCNLLQFDPALSLQPTTAESDSPSGVNVDLTVPQNEAPGGLATPPLKDATVTVPGLSVSPSAADGLQACSDAQAALDTTDPATCPDASQIGSVNITTPILPDPLTGQIFLLTPNCSPCSNTDAQNGNMLRGFLQVSADGVLIKVRGTFSVDPQSGQIVAHFLENPQFPFSDLQLSFKSGPRGIVATPETCGSFTTIGDLRPWSAPDSGSDAVTTDSFQLTSGANGTPCVSDPFQLPFAPAFGAGTTNPQAGAFSSLTLSFSRADSDQQFSGLSVTLPPGLLGKLAGIPLCSEADANAGTCSAASQVGSVNTGAGPGSHPFFLPGKVYLTGPYHGGPYGLSVEVPAVAGPFNLGTVVVRQSLRVDPHTAQATVISDPFPRILDGIPLKIRTVNVAIDRAGFTFNPTSCEPTQIAGTLISLEERSVPVSSRFQAANCAALEFAPKFSASTAGVATPNGSGASFHVSILAKGNPTADGSIPGEANIKRVDVQLPKLLPARLTTLQKACTATQFASNPAGCPEASFVGHAIAHTPVLSSPLTGPAILVSHGGAAFPDLVLVLQADGIRLDLVGNTAIKRGITSSKFEAIPDAPISAFELDLPRSRHSALSASSFGGFCGDTKSVSVRERVTVRNHGRISHLLRTVQRLQVQPLSMATLIEGQNGTVLTRATKVAVTGCPHLRAKKPKTVHRVKPRKRKGR